MALVIKKRVSLEFLGEEYTDSYLILKSISVKDYEALGDVTVRDAVVERFIEGKIKQDGKLVDITKENLEELPGEAFVEAFERISGKTDPKS